MPPFSHGSASHVKSPDVVSTLVVLVVSASVVVETIVVVVSPAAVVVVVPLEPQVKQTSVAEAPPVAVLESKRSLKIRTPFALK